MLEEELDFHMSEQYELEQGESAKSIKGNLRKHFKFWQVNCTNQFILDAIKEGYKIPFITLHESSHDKNNRSTYQYHSFVTEAIDQLVSEGRIVACPIKPKVR